MIKAVQRISGIGYCKNIYADNFEKKGSHLDQNVFPKLVK